MHLMVKRIRCSIKAMKILEFGGTFTAFIGDLASVSHYVRVRVVNPTKNLQLSQLIFLWSTTCTPLDGSWGLPLLMEADTLTQMHQQMLKTVVKTV